MKPLKRKPINKHNSAKKFRKDISHTKAANIQKPRPMRGGYRL